MVHVIVYLGSSGSSTSGGSSSAGTGSAYERLHPFTAAPPHGCTPEHFSRPQPLRLRTQAHTRHSHWTSATRCHGLHPSLQLHSPQSYVPEYDTLTQLHGAMRAKKIEGHTRNYAGGGACIMQQEPLHYAGRNFAMVQAKPCFRNKNRLHYAATHDA